jgi:hypothetical protein
MGVVALIVWLATAAAGLYLLAVWLIEYDRDFQTTAATRLPVPLISSHALLAVGGLAVWGAYLLFDDDRLAWLSLIILGCVATLGLTMAVRWLAVYRSTRLSPAMAGRGGPPPRPGGTFPPERNFPMPVVVGHGILAITTIVLVLLTTLEVWKY